MDISILISVLALAVALAAEAGVCRFRRKYEKPLAAHQLRSAEREEIALLSADIVCSTVHRNEGRVESVTIFNRGHHDAECVTFSLNPAVPFAMHDNDMTDVLVANGEPFELYFQNNPPVGSVLTIAYTDGLGAHDYTKLIHPR